MSGNLKSKITDDFKQAFKEKNEEKKSVLSMLRSEISNKEIELKKREEGLNDDEVMDVVRRAVKQRKDAMMQYKEGGREELAEKEQKEIVILESYLPAQMSDEELEKEVSQIVFAAKEQGSVDMGKIMGMAMGKLKGKADGTRVKAMVEKLIQ